MQIPAIDQLAIHFAMDSNLLHKESDEARRQLAQLEGAESSESEGEEDEEQGDDDKEEVLARLFMRTRMHECSMLACRIHVHVIVAPTHLW